MAWSMESVDDIYKHYCTETNGMDDLEIVEAIAEDRNRFHSGNFFADEESVSTEFDGLYAESLDPDDEPMISEAFSNFVDSLTKEGRLHTEQYRNYDYVGKLAYD